MLLSAPAAVVPPKTYVAEPFGVEATACAVRAGGAPTARRGTEAGEYQLSVCSEKAHGPSACSTPPTSPPVSSRQGPVLAGSAQPAR